MLLTGEANRFYASGFHSFGGDGVSLVTGDKCYYFTDSRYTEAAGRQVQDAEIREIGRGRGYSVLIGEAVAAHGIHRMPQPRPSSAARRRCSSVSRSCCSRASARFFSATKLPLPATVVR